MLMLLPVLIAVAAQVSPGAEPAASSAGTTTPTPLREIGRVRARPACVPIVAHANGAITQALDNDRTLAILSNNLHTVDFDKLNSLQRRNAIEGLMKQAEAIRVAARGETFLQPSVAAKVVAEFARLTRKTERAAAPLAEPLSERELEILGLIAKGASNREIAAALFLAEGTVKNHVTNILGKLDARDRTQAAIKARDKGLI